MSFTRIKSIFQESLKPELTLDDILEFNVACKVGNLQTVKDTLEKKKTKHIGIPVLSCLNNVCEKGHLEIIEYLLTSPYAGRFQEDFRKYSKPIALAAEYGHLEMLKFFLTSPKLKNLVDPTMSHDYIFKGLSFSDPKHVNIIKFLIFDINVKRTDYINEILKFPHNKGMEELFDIRDDHAQLQKDLKTNTNEKPSKKLKI